MQQPPNPLCIVAAMFVVMTCACSSPKKIEEPTVFTHDAELLAGKPFGETPDFARFLEKQRNRHALLLADLKNTRSLTMVDDRHQVAMMIPSLKLRKLELDSILSKLANVAEWSAEQRNEVRAVLEEESRWVNESIAGFESVR